MSRVERNLLKPDVPKRSLEDIGEPNLYRDQFPFSEVPRIFFDGVTVPLNLPDEFWITCTTFRDGQQARPPYTIEQMVKLYQLMHKLGGPKGIIRQCEFFLYTENDRKTVEQCLAFGFEAPEVTGWIRAVKADFQRVKEMQLKETGILTSASDYHIFLKLKKNRQEAMDGYCDVVAAALETGIKPRCHLEDVTRADFYGFVVPFVQRLITMCEEAKNPVKIRLCDTMGYGVPYPDAALPRSVPKLVSCLMSETGIGSSQIEWHGHNDFHKVLVNAQAAWLYGCSAANGTLLGFGERTGNPPIEGLCIEYAALKGNTDGMDLKAITEIGNYFRNDVGATIPGNYPFVGSEFNTTSAGIHADGVMKNEEIYNIFDTGALLSRPPGVTITDKSGVAGVAYWVEHNLSGPQGKTIDKRSPGIAKIYEWVMEQYNAGRITGISSNEMMIQARKHLPEFFQSE